MERNGRGRARLLQWRRWRWRALRGGERTREEAREGAFERGGRGKRVGTLCSPGRPSTWMLPLRMATTRRSTAVGHGAVRGARGGEGGRRQAGPFRPRWKRGARPAGAPVPFFFNFFLKCFSNTFLTILESFSEVVLKIKVAPNKILYNFTLRCHPKIQIDFELQFKASYRFK